MKHFIPLCLAALVSGTAVQASPLCDAFSSADQMPKKYRQLAPVLSGASTDWIITDDQMNTEYAPDTEALDLLAEIVAEFQARGTNLAILMPPPRPLVAGQSVLDALSDGAVDFDVDAVGASFNHMIELVRETGAIVPNLLELATRDDELRDAFYYRHDTHWTPRGAAESAVALAQEVVAAELPAFKDSNVVSPEVDTGESFSERGSLAGMAKAVCGAEIAPVVTQIPVFPSPEMGLLADTSSQPKIILAGSSFSNRYKKDAYRVADAVSRTLQADVVNHSVSGGGAIGAVEGIVNEGFMSSDMSADLVVWELPYTEGLRSIGILRQLLGALRFDSTSAAKSTTKLDGSGKTRVDFTDGAPDLLALDLPQSTAQRVKVDLRFADGSKTTLGLVRKKNVPAALKSDRWAVSLAELRSPDLISATVRYDPASIGPKSTVQLY